MQNVAQAIAFVGILVFLAHLFVGIFSRTRIPDVILLIIIGICVGPVLGLASPPTEDGNVYFELRVGEKPEDPKRWLQLKGGPS